MTEQRGEVLVRVEGVSKKFCRSLKRSLWYGVQDVTSELMGQKGSLDELRQGEFWAVDDVSFELRRGECLGLVGPNGAGKSTLLKMLNGLIKPDKGRITMRGKVGALIELGAGFNPILTARENIYVNGSVLGLSKKEIDHRFDAIVDFAEIDEFVDTPVQSFSSGMRVRLGFSIAAQLKPDILLLDEILSVGDSAFRGKCVNRILEIKDECAVVFVSHNMAQVARISNSVAYVDRGRLEMFQNTPAQGIATYESKIFPVLDRCNVESEWLAIESVGVGSRSGGSDSCTFSVSGPNAQIDVVMRVKNIVPEAVTIFLVLLNSELQTVVEIWRPVEEQALVPDQTAVQSIFFDASKLSSGKYYVSCAVLMGLERRIVANSQYASTLVIDSGWVGYAPVRI